jgi:hypothetical protein
LAAASKRSTQRATGQLTKPGLPSADPAMGQRRLIPLFFVFSTTVGQSTELAVQLVQFPPTSLLGLQTVPQILHLKIDALLVAFFL